MTAPFLDGTPLRIVHQVRKMLLAEGYYPLTMTKIAKACGLTRRGLYHHFRSKEQLLRAMLVLANNEARDAADWAAQKAMARGAGALDVVSEWLDSRYGATRRLIAHSPGGEDLNRAAFSIANDILIEVSRESNARLAALLEELCRRGALRLKPGRSAAELADIIGDGARGVNQQRPPVPPQQIARRYRRIAEAILFGCAQTS
jgi:AcrR family transcriptional regulator